MFQLDGSSDVSVVCEREHELNNLDVGSSGHVCSRVVPLLYMMYGLSLAWMEHFVLWHVQVRIHGGLMLSHIKSRPCGHVSFSLRWHNVQ